MPNHPVIDAADQFRDLLLRMERAQAMRFVNAYGQIYTDLQGMIEALTVELAGMDEPKAWQVARLARWKELRQQIDRPGSATCRTADAGRHPPADGRGDLLRVEPAAG